MRKKQIAALGLSCMLLVSLPGRNAYAEVRGVSPKAALCRAELPRVKPFVLDPRLSLQTSVSNFPRIERALRTPDYRAAAKLMHDFEGYPSGNVSTARYPEGEYLFIGRYRAAFISAYQAAFCYDSTQLDRSASDAPEVAATYAAALEAAAAGKYGTAIKLAKKSYRDSGKYLGEALIVAGEIDVASGRLNEARGEWLAALDVHGYPAPGRDSEFIAPPRVAAAEYLLHYRP